ncbi:MAG: hypothetical protein HYV78_01695 [Candidatus Wildermuthbacteria bacterium]|nr:hypothetical protein [Candidatus Wildermuthbacteria bacterium]
MPITPKEFWKLYETLPQELKDAVFSEETGDIIYAACQRNDIMPLLPIVTDAVGEVLLGMLPFNEFEKKLTTLTISPEKAKRVALEISRHLFVPNREAIAALHIPQEQEKGLSAKETAVPAESIVLPQSKSEKRQRLSEKDTYRESIE